MCYAAATMQHAPPMSRLVVYISRTKADKSNNKQTKCQEHKAVGAFPQVCGNRSFMCLVYPRLPLITTWNCTLVVNGIAH